MVGDTVGRLVDDLDYGWSPCVNEWIDRLVCWMVSLRVWLDRLVCGWIDW